MTEQLSTSYDSKKVEDIWYQHWMDNKLFAPQKEAKKPPYSIVIPPPNVTGTLHMGHALVNTLQDVLIRWKRMQGHKTVWVPGTDHAGIATQTVVEKHLIKTERKKRIDYSREEFLSHVWKWKEDNENKIINQLKQLGCSCDWDRQRFTMDEKNNLAVRQMFKKMFDQGLIYRGDYLVNWDPITQTALADDEVEYEEKSSFLWHIKYPLTDSSEYLVIATTRPETMLGDTAVAVHPKDERYSHLIGQTITLPITKRKIPIIADHYVDPEFGTGALKITPAHDPNDYQIGLRHDLAMINLLNPDGTLNEKGCSLAGLTMLEARKKVEEILDQENLLIKKEPHTHRVGISYRSKAIIEPMLSKQWFVKMSGFAPKLRAAVEEGLVKLTPKTWENSYYHWIDNLRDWCISRQLWWGHRIPIWYSKSDPEKILCSADETPQEVLDNPDEWEQDSDVLDTWFSSALFPFAAFNWPEKSSELEEFYPNSTLVTGHDILFFWVARMILMGEYALNKPPFPETFLHGLIFAKSYWREDKEHGILYVSKEEQKAYDLGEKVPSDVKSKWEKMSKSKGNIIDPLEIIDQYGTDAMRIALCSSATQARQIDLDRRRFEEFKNFTNKLWNGARFVFMNLNGDDPLTAQEFSQGLDLNRLMLEDRWILSLLNRTNKEINQLLEKYAFDHAALKAYDFFWKEFCAYYVEITKPTLFGKANSQEDRKNKQKILAIVLSSALRLLHPMAPFITEELFSKLQTLLQGSYLQDGQDPYTQEAITALNAQACIVAPYPQVILQDDLNESIEEAFSFIEKVIYSIRNIRGEMKLPPSMRSDLHFVSSNSDLLKTIQENQSIIEALIRVENIAYGEKEPDIAFCSTAVVNDLKIMIPLPKELIEKEKKRLEKEVEKVSINIEKLEAKLSNPNFVEKAPEKLVNQQRELLERAKKEKKEIEEKLL